MPTVFQRAAARRDLVDHFLYLADNAGDAVAYRFLVQAESTYAELAAQPAIGSPLSLRRPQLAGLRKWRVRDFERCLIFYLPHPQGVSIIRVLNADQEWWRILEI